LRKNHVPASITHEIDIGTCPSKKSCRHVAPPAEPFEQADRWPLWHPYGSSRAVDRARSRERLQRWHIEIMHYKETSI
jgi:hypothetical protein